MADRDDDREGDLDRTVDMVERRPKADPDCLPGTLYMLPQDVRDAMAMTTKAEDDYRSGLITGEDFWTIYRQTTDIITKAAQERRIGVITNLAS